MTHPTISVRCFRYDPEADAEPRYQDYAVPLSGGEMSVHDCLEYIRDNLDPSLAYFINCHLGFCRRCSMRMNGKVVLACETPAEEGMVLEPVNREEVVRDLWCEST